MSQGELLLLTLLLAEAAELARSSSSLRLKDGNSPAIKAMEMWWAGTDLCELADVHGGSHFLSIHHS